MIKPILQSVISPVLSAINSSVILNSNVYLFGVGNTSSLQMGALFTGNFKGWIAGTSNTGVNPDLLALVVGNWQDTTDLDNPVWNKISGDVTDLAYIVDSTFVGYVPMYAKDDVWINIDMGEPTLRWVPTFDRATTYMELDTPFIASGSFTVLLTYYSATLISGTTLIGGDSLANSITMDVEDDQLRAYAFVGTNIQPIAQLTIAPYVGEIVYVTLEYDEITNIATLSINEGVVSASVEWLLAGTEVISKIGIRGDGTRVFDGIVYDVNLNGTEYALDQSFDEYPIFDGLTAYNFVESDVVEIIE